MAIVPSVKNETIYTETLPALEEERQVCGGHRVRHDSESDSFPDCAACNGSGLVPTSIGARILDLLRHNSRVTLSAALEVSSVQQPLPDPRAIPSPFRPPQFSAPR